ncbi:MAG: 4'-phosphopantetheinyl transferase superfamily protein [Odoribacteraceae bacterium]|jgi:4'-phosphopantetheinyl transferase|nr:4'-phosphopantetheinyl transferase superfamily protein [Odoribacteraceae bacterium]
MLNVWYTRVPDERGEKKVALRHLAGELLVRRFMRSRGYPDHYEIQKGEKGKPYVAGAESAHFNISHSGEFVAAAFSNKEVGIDIERRGRVRLDVAARFFHPEEVAALLAIPEERRARQLTDYWAIKESFLKYLGTGLSRPLSTFRVHMEKAGVFLYEEDTRLPVHVRPCPVGVSYSCFTCSETASRPRATEVAWMDLYNKEWA